MGVGHWAAAIVGIFAVTLVFMPIIGAFNDIILPTFYNNTTSQGQTAMLIIQNAFNMAPWIMIIGLVIYAFASSELREYRRERDSPDF